MSQLLEPRSANAYTSAMGMKPSGRPLWVSEMATHAKATNNGGSGLRLSRLVAFTATRTGRHELVDGEHYGGRSTTSVLRAYDRTGVGVGASRINEPAYGSTIRNSGGIGSTLRDADVMNTTWDSMGRGPRPRPYDYASRSLGINSGSTGSYGTYMGVRASGGATRFR